MNVTELPPHHGGATVVGSPAVVRWWWQPALHAWFRRHGSHATLPVIDSLALVGVLLVVGPVDWLGAAYGAAVFGVLAAEGQHRLRLCLRTSDQVPRIAVAGLAPLAVFAVWSPAEASLSLGLSTVAVLVVSRSLLCSALRRAHEHGALMEPTVIIGSGATAVQLARLLDEHPEFGSKPRGFLDRRPPEEDSRTPLLGEVAELAEVVARYGITRVIVCFGGVADAELVSVLRSSRSLRIDVCVVPRLYELGMAVPRGCFDEVWGVPLVPLRHHGRLSMGPLVKRGFDLVAGGALVVLLAPLLLALTGLVRVLSGSNTFFHQLRVSRCGKSVDVVKLRTVRAAAGEAWAVRDEECTSFGRWLRSTHFDELPQLLMVLRGEMSLVGPRPERPYYAMRFAREIPRYDDRHRMPGGMTGWAQVHGLHGDTSIQDRARFDNQYIEYWSLWLDAVIVARTCAIVLIAAGRSLVTCRTASGRGQR